MIEYAVLVSPVNYFHLSHLNPIYLSQSTSPTPTPTSPHFSPASPNFTPPTSIQLFQSPLNPTHLLKPCLPQHQALQLNSTHLSPNPPLSNPASLKSRLSQPSPTPPHLPAPTSHLARSFPQIPANAIPALFLGGITIRAPLNEEIASIGVRFWSWW